MIEFTFPSSDIFAADDMHARRALFGGPLAGSWVSWIEGGTRRVVSFRVDGIGLDPRDWDDRLDGATWAEADLGSSPLTAAEVATAFATAADSIGSDWTVDGDAASLAAANSSIVGPAMAASVPATRGMWGRQRIDWGELDTNEQDGAIGGTGSVHVPAPGDGRVRGIYIRSAGGNDVRVALGRGPAFSLTPGPITILAQGVITAAADNDLRWVVFDEPVEISASDELWIEFRGISDQTMDFRAHAQTPEGNGDLPVGQNLLFDTDEADPAVPIASPYTPNVAANYPIYMFVGLLYESADGDGRYPGDGSIDTWVGNLRASAGGGSPATAGPAATADEVTVQRIAMPQWTAADVVAAAYAVQAWSAADDLGLAFYEWNDAALPTATTNPLLQSTGRWGTTGTGWQVHTLSSPLPVGTDVLGADAVLGVASNFGAIAGGQASALTIVFDDEDPGGTRTWSTAWPDGGLEWNDFLDESSVLPEEMEYRTFGSDENSVMVAGDPTTAWPDPYDPGVIDDRPRNLPRLRIRLQRAGISAEETASDLTIALDTSGARGAETLGLSIAFTEPDWMAAFNSNSLPLRNE